MDPIKANQELIAQKKQLLDLSKALGIQEETNLDIVARSTKARKDANVLVRSLESSLSSLSAKENKALKKKIGTEIKLSKLTDKESKAAKKYIKDIQKESAKLNAIADQMGNIEKIQEKFENHYTYIIKSEKELESALEHRLRMQNESIDAMVKYAGLSEEAAEIVKRNLKTEKAVAKEREKLSETAPPDVKYREELKKKAAKIDPTMPGQTGAFAKQEKMDLGKEMQGKIKGLISAKGIKGKLEAGKDMMDTVKKGKVLSEEMKKMGMVAQGTTGMFGMLGTAMSALGKIGWVGIILSAVTTIVKAVNELNKFVKGFNKTFLKIYGPTVALKDVAGSMKNFTDAIFNMNRNLKYGLKSEEIMGLFQAMSAGGMSLQGVGKRVQGGYNDVIDTAIKISKNFGVSLEDAGGMISEQMMDLRASLGDVQDAFAAMSYDATIAGVSSQKFYDATMSAASGLSFYGNYLKDASKMMRDFVDSGTLGFKDAAKEVENLTGLFKNMSFEQRMGTFALSGGIQKWTKLYQNVFDESSKKEEVLGADIKAMEESAAKITNEVVKQELYKKIEAKKRDLEQQKRAKTLADMALKGGETAMAQLLPLLSKEVPGTVLDIMKGMENVDIWDHKNLVRSLQTLQTVTGGAADDWLKVITRLNLGVESAKKASTEISKAYGDLGGDTKKELLKTLKPYLSGEKTDLNELKKELEDKKFDLGKTLSVDTLLKQFEKNARVVEASLEGAVLSDKDYQNIVEEAFRKTGGLTPVGGDEDKRIGDIVKNTATFEDFLGITKENATYMAAMAGGGKLQDVANNAIIWMSKNVGGIFGLLARWAGGAKYTTVDQYKKSPDWAQAKGAAEEQAYLTGKMNDAIERGQTEEVDRLGKLIGIQQKIKEDSLKGFEELTFEVDTKGQEKAAKKLEAVIPIKDSIDKINSDLKSLSGVLGDEKASKEDKQRASEAIAATNAEIANAKKRLQVAEGASVVQTLDTPPTTTSAGWQVGGKPWAFPEGTFDQKHKTVPTTEPPVKDFLAMSEGYRNIAKGIGAGAGQFSPRLGAMAGGAGATTVSVPITLQIGSVNGDVDDLVKKIGPVVQQTFERMYFDKQKR